MPNPSIKDEDVYQALRDQGASKEKAARIANAKAAGDKPSRKGGKASPYEDWTVEALRRRAAELDVSGRSKMRKAELIEALRAR
ncbi:DUF7218 family protein [Albimonas pacifica]|uniref:Rho termination factor, N-terminal domain n=1 Tax=Albimonas pacifica TaxID=1114924 RepID=A0A1I3KVC4_9RHOB|nr:Rho termination factor N-terminal domain-containing protein [Albimonas pacifica]SFI76479.1 Rho termination factor, N-terminal domain [Albimonas pacifica]